MTTDIVSAWNPLFWDRRKAGFCGRCGEPREVEWINLCMSCLDVERELRRDDHWLIAVAVVVVTAAVFVLLWANGALP